VKLGDERGAAAVEMALLAPVLVLMLATVVAAGRVVETKSAVLAVAREAARAGSEAPDASEARQVASERARQVAAGLGLDPARLVISQEPGGFRRGDPYTVSVTYRVALTDLPGLGIVPGSFVLSAQHTEIVERFKSR
jgi:Flp pilus assembly protein TadG